MLSPPISLTGVTLHPRFERVNSCSKNSRPRPRRTDPRPRRALLDSRRVSTSTTISLVTTLDPVIEPCMALGSTDSIARTLTLSTSRSSLRSNPRGSFFELESTRHSIEPCSNRSTSTSTVLDVESARIHARRAFPLLDEPRPRSRLDSTRLDDRRRDAREPRPGGPGFSTRDAMEVRERRVP